MRDIKCDASVVGCFDNRFEAVCRKFLKRIGVVQPDPIKIAGGAKSLASPEEEFHRKFVLGEIHKSIELHGTSRIILLVHSDCGAYGGLAGFQGDVKAEAIHHRAELRCAAAFLKKEIPDITVDCFFLDFEGVWTLDEKRAAVSARV